jgi:hypothetical protein
LSAIFQVGVFGELEEAMQADRQEIGAIPRGDDGADTWPGLWSGITDAARATVFLHIDRLPSSECQPESIATRLSARRRKGFSVDDLTAMTKDVRDIHNRLPGRSRQPFSGLSSEALQPADQRRAKNAEVADIVLTL